MATGAQVVAKGAVANSAYLTYQPSAGVEAVIKSISLAADDDAYVKLTADGSTYIDFIDGAHLKVLCGQVATLVSNGMFIVCGNESGGSLKFCMVGVQTK